MDTANIKPGDRIRFRAVTRWSAAAVWRVVTGRLFGNVTVRYGGTGNFIVHDHEILEHEAKE